MSRKQEHVMKKKTHRKIKEPRDGLKTHGEERFEEREFAQQFKCVTSPWPVGFISL